MHYSMVCSKELTLRRLQEFPKSDAICHSLVAQLLKNPPAMWKTWVQSLGGEDALEEGMATHCSILAWRIPMDTGAWWATVHGFARVRHDGATKHSTAEIKNTQRGS